MNRDDAKAAIFALLITAVAFAITMTAMIHSFKNTESDPAVYERYLQEMQERCPEEFENNWK